MTKSYVHHEADSSPSDFGAIEHSNTPELWQSFIDGEIDRLKDMEPGTPL